MEPAGEGASDIIDVTAKQLLYSCYRTAQISVGISWANHADKQFAGILASHTISVHVCGVGLAFNEDVKEIIEDSVVDALNMYYNAYGVPYTKPKGKPAINFVKKKQ